MKARKKRLLVFGNPLVKEDSLPLEILPMLREEFPEYEFAEFDAAENLDGRGKIIVYCLIYIQNMALLLI